MKFCSVKLPTAKSCSARVSPRSPQGCEEPVLRVDLCRRRAPRSAKAHRLELKSSLDELRHLNVPAEGVCEAHLVRAAAIGLEKGGVGDKNAGRAGAGDGDVKTVQAVKKLHASRGFFG